MGNGHWTFQRIRLGLSIVSCALSILSCSIPAIESPDCTAAREVAKRYYSLAIGGDIANQPDSMTQFKKLLAPDFSVSGADLSGGRDPYNFSMITPSSSRFDECVVQQDGKPTINVTVIWRHNDQNYLRKDKVTLARSGDTWLIERIDVGPQPQPDF